MRLEIDLERVRLGNAPTPVRELAALGNEAGAASVWIKDDGAYSEVGGNKARKLEWLLADARRRRKRAVLTGGALGTNHGLATTIFARRLGMRTILVLGPQPRTAHVRAQLARLEASGAEIHLAPGFARSYLLAAWLMASRSRPGSGGTAAGLMAGMRLAGLRSRLVCVLVSDVAPVGARRVARLARRTLAMLRRHGIKARGRAPSPGELDVQTEWLGPGYGHATPEGERATGLLRERAGVELEPVYTSKAVAALLELNRRGAFGSGPVLYWHTYSPPVAL